MAKAETCGKSDCACEKKSRAFGSATWVAVAFAICVVGAALWFSVKDMATVKASTTTASRAWFPEPSFLLVHKNELRLTAEQTRHVQVASRVWNLQKAALNTRLRTLGKDSDQALRDLTSGKKLSGSYADLVADFDKARLKAWADASSTLNGDQVLAIDDLRNGIQPSLPQNAVISFQAPGATEQWEKIAKRADTVQELDREIKRADSRLARAMRRKPRNQERVDMLHRTLDALHAKKSALVKYRYLLEPHSVSPNLPRFTELQPSKSAPQPNPLAPPAVNTPLAHK